MSFRVLRVLENFFGNKTSYFCVQSARNILLKSHQQRIRPAVVTQTVHRLCFHCKSIFLPPNWSRHQPSGAPQAMEDQPDVLLSVHPQPKVCVGMGVCVDQSSFADQRWIDSIMKGNLEIFSRFFHLFPSLIFTSLWPLLPFDLSQHGADTLSNQDFTPFCHISAI